MNKNLIVSASDQKYSELLIELYNSTKILDNYDFAILDCGLNNESLEFFKKKNIEVVKSEWHVDIPNYKVRGREYLKAQFSRFYLDYYFPGYENYIWMDSDTWINCKETFNYYLIGAIQSGFSITPQIDRASSKIINIKWFFNFPYKINSINYKNISRSLNKALGRKYAGYYTINAGCFAYNYKFDGIKNIRKNLSNASEKGRIFGTDQVALAITMFEDKVPFELLPSYCNWMCEHHLPKFCSKSNKFVEPFIPNTNIGVMHLAGLDTVRVNKNLLHEVQTLEGNKIRKSLRNI